jgi:hypothetical protein
VSDVWNGTDFVIGEMFTPGFGLNESGTNGSTSLSEATQAYRSIEKTTDQPVLPVIPFSRYQNVRCLSERYGY